MSWLAWVVVLVCYDFVTSLLSRAVNSGSLWWHATIGLVANSLYYVRLLSTVAIGLDAMVEVGVVGNWRPLLLFAVLCTSGSVAGHWVSMRFVEHGNRRVGSRM